MSSLKFKSAGLFLVISFFAQGTLGWIRFRYPFSRRVYLQQTTPERLQNCAEQAEERCGICGEGPGELPTTTIPDRNYLSLELSRNVLEVQVAFRADLHGYFEFRLCELGMDVVRSGSACRNTPPLTLMDGRRIYSPSARQSSAIIPLAIPEQTTCDRCILQVKYMPDKDPDALGNHTFYDCAPVTISARPTETFLPNSVGSGFPPDHIMSETVRTTSLLGNSANPRVASLVRLGRTGGQSVGRLVVSKGSAGANTGRFGTNSQRLQTRQSQDARRGDTVSGRRFAESVIVRNNLSSWSSSGTMGDNQNSVDISKTSSSGTNNDSATVTSSADTQMGGLAEEMAGMSFTDSTFSDGSHNTAQGHRGFTNNIATSLSLSEGLTSDNFDGTVVFDNALVSEPTRDVFSGSPLGTVTFLTVNRVEDGSFNNGVVNGNTVGGSLQSIDGSNLSHGFPGTDVAGNTAKGTTRNKVIQGNNLPGRTFITDTGSRSIDSTLNHVNTDSRLEGSSKTGIGNTQPVENAVMSGVLGTGVVDNTFTSEADRTVMRDNSLSSGTVGVRDDNTMADGSTNSIRTTNNQVRNTVMSNVLATENTMQSEPTVTGVNSNIFTDETRTTIIRNNNELSRFEGPSSNTVKANNVVNNLLGSDGSTIVGENIVSDRAFGSRFMGDTLTSVNSRNNIQHMELGSLETGDFNANNVLNSNGLGSSDNFEGGTVRTTITGGNRITSSSNALDGLVQNAVGDNLPVRDSLTTATVDDTRNTLAGEFGSDITRGIFIGTNAIDNSLTNVEGTVSRASNGNGLTMTNGDMLVDKAMTSNSFQDYLIDNTVSDQIMRGVNKADYDISRSGFDMSMNTGPSEGTFQYTSSGNIVPSSNTIGDTLQTNSGRFITRNTGVNAATSGFANNGNHLISNGFIRRTDSNVLASSGTGNMGTNGLASADIGTNGLVSGDMGTNGLVSGHMGTNGLVSGDMGTNALVSGDLGANGFVRGDMGTNALVSGHIGTNSLVSGNMGTSELVSGDMGTNALVSGHMGTNSLVSGNMGTSELVSGDMGTNGFVSGDMGTNGLASGDMGTNGLVSRNMGTNGLVSGDMGTNGLVSGDMGTNGLVSGHMGTNSFESVITNINDNTLSSDFVGGGLFETSERGTVDGNMLTSGSFRSTSNAFLPSDLTVTDASYFSSDTFNDNAIIGSDLTSPRNTDSNNNVLQTVFNNAPASFESRTGTLPKRTSPNGDFTATNGILSVERRMENNMSPDIFVSTSVQDQSMQGVNTASRGVSRFGVDVTMNKGSGDFMRESVHGNNIGGDSGSVNMFTSNDSFRQTNGDLSTLSTGRISVEATVMNNRINSIDVSHLRTNVNDELYSNNSAVPMEQYVNSASDSWLPTNVNHSDSSGSLTSSTVQNNNMIYDNQLSIDGKSANTVVNGSMGIGGTVFNNEVIINANETYRGPNATYDWYLDNSTQFDSQNSFNDSALFNESVNSNNVNGLINISNSEFYQTIGATNNSITVNKGVASRDLVYQTDVWGEAYFDPSTSTSSSLVADTWIQNDYTSAYNNKTNDLLQNAFNITPTDKNVLSQEIVNVPNTITVFPLKNLTPNPITVDTANTPHFGFRQQTDIPVPSTYSHILSETTTANPTNFRGFKNIPTQTTDIPFPARGTTASVNSYFTGSIDSSSGSSTQHYDYISYQNTESPVINERQIDIGVVNQGISNSHITGQRIVETNIDQAVKDKNFINSDSSGNIIHTGSSILTNVNNTVVNQQTSNVNGISTFQFDGKRKTVVADSQLPIETVTVGAFTGFYDVTQKKNESAFGSFGFPGPDVYDISPTNPTPMSQDIPIIASSSTENITSNVMQNIQGFQNNMLETLSTVAPVSASNVINDLNNARIETSNVFYEREITNGRFGDSNLPTFTDLPPNLPSIPYPQPVNDVTIQQATEAASTLHDRMSTTTEIPNVMYDTTSVKIPEKSMTSADLGSNLVADSTSQISLSEVQKNNYTLVGPSSVNSVRESTSTRTEDVHFMDLVDNVDRLGGVPIDNGQISAPGSFFILSKPASSVPGERISDGTSFDVTNSLSPDQNLRDQTSRSGFVVYNFTDTASARNSFADSNAPVRKDPLKFSSDNRVIADIARNGNSNINRIRMNVKTESISSLADTEITPNAMPPIVFTNNVPETPILSRAGMADSLNTETAISYDGNTDINASSSSISDSNIDNTQPVNVLRVSKEPVATSTVWRGLGINGNTPDIVYSLNENTAGYMNDPMAYHYFNLIQGNSPPLQFDQLTQFNELSSTVNNKKTVTRPVATSFNDAQNNVENNAILINESTKSIAGSANTNVSSSTLWDLNRRNKESVDAVTYSNTVNYDVRSPFVTWSDGPFTQSRIDTVIRSDTSVQTAPDVMPPIEVDVASDRNAGQATRVITRKSGDINIRILQTLEELVTELRKRDPATSPTTEQIFTGLMTTDGIAPAEFGQDIYTHTLSDSNVDQGSSLISPMVDPNMFYLTDPSLTNAIPPPIIPRDNVEGFSEIGTVKLGNLRGISDERRWLINANSKPINFNNRELSNQNTQEPESIFKQPVIALPKQTGNMYQLLMGTFANVSATKRKAFEEMIVNNVNEIPSVNTKDILSVDNTVTLPVQIGTELPFSNENSFVSTRKQRIIHAPEGQIQNPFAGTNIPLHNITDTLGNIMALEPQYRASSVSEAWDQTNIALGGQTYPLGDSRDPISIEGKYYIGEMRRNAHGQFEPVPVGANVLQNANGTPQVSIQTMNTITTSLDATIPEVKDTNRPIVLTNTPVRMATREPSIVLTNTPVRMATREPPFELTNTPERMATREPRLNAGNQEFINQEALLNLIDRQQDARNVRTETPTFFKITDRLPNSFSKSVDPPAVTCSNGEQFVCNAVGSYRNIPGMVWWCFSHCKHEFCPREKCDCTCEVRGVSEPVREVKEPVRIVREPVREVREQVVNSNKSPKNTGVKKSRVKKVINLTLNGSKESLVRVGEGNESLVRVGEGKESLVRVGEGFSAFSEKMLQPRSVESSFATNRLNLDGNVLAGSSRKDQVSDQTRLGLVCRGIHAFADTAGMDTWCTTMCRRNVCPTEICAC